MQWELIGPLATHHQGPIAPYWFKGPVNGLLCIHGNWPFAGYNWPFAGYTWRAFQREIAIYRRVYDNYFQSERTVSKQWYREN